MADTEYEGPPLEIDLAVALGVIYDSPNEARRVRLLDAAEEETATLSGVLTCEQGEGFVRLVAGDGGLSVEVTIPLDSGTRCTISPDGGLTGVLPSGATWITTPAVARGLI
jgi:hypothetical protein